MYNEIYQSSVDEAEEGVLIARAVREEHQRARSIIDIAQRNASHIISHAQQEADALRSKGWREGYCNGLMSAVNAIALFISDGESLQRRLQYELRNELSQCLAEVLQNADILPPLVSGWAQQLTSDESEQPVTLLLPQAWRQDVGRITASLAAVTGRPLRYEYHDEMRCVFKFRDSLAEFDPLEINQHLCETLLTAKALPHLVQYHTNESLVRLKETLAERLDELILITEK